MVEELNKIKYFDEGKLVSQTEWESKYGASLTEEGVQFRSVGIKHDQGKLRYDLISPTSLEGLAEVLTFGANKYSARNWEKGMSYGRVFGAAMRHLWAWWAKKGTDPETGFSHLKHALCCIHFLVHYEQHKVGTDDRP